MNEFTYYNDGYDGGIHCIQDVLSQIS